MDTIKGLLRELWRYKLVIPAVMALVAGLFAFTTLREPKIYEASTTLEYDPNPARPLGDAVEEQQSDAWWDSQEFYETQNFILRSRSLAERVVLKLGFHRDPVYLGIPEGDRASFSEVPPGDVAERVQGQLDVEPVRDTRVVTLTVQDGDPERAALIANAYAEAYIEKSLEDRLGASSRALEWLSEQMQHLKRDVESSDLALYKFREDNHALSASLQERQKVIGEQLSAYTESLTQLNAKRIQTGAHLTVLRELLAEAQDPNSLYASPLASDDAIAPLRDKCREATLNLQKLSLTYGPAHPLVQGARTELEELRTQLQAQVASITRGVEGELKEVELAAKGLRTALEEVNHDGLELSLQEIQYSRLDRDRANKSELYQLVVERAAQTNLTRALRVANARIVDRAVVPSMHVSPKARRSVIFGLLLGLILGVATALGISQLDNKVRGVSDLEVRGIALLGALPSVQSVVGEGPSHRAKKRKGRRGEEDASRDLMVYHQPRSTMAECCRTIRTNITFQSADQPPRALAVTSATPRDGKTTVAISLAITLAQSGRSVLLIDTDLRRPRVHRAFGLASASGVTSVLAGEALLDEAAQATEVPGVSVLQCGPLPPNPSELLHTRRFSELLAEARSKYDLVVLDTPPIGAVTDPAIIATQVDGTILVVRSRSTSRAGVDAAMRKLRDVSARVLGAVLNDVSHHDGDSYYAQYRGYYAEEETADPPPPPSSDAAQSRA